MWFRMLPEPGEKINDLPANPDQDHDFNFALERAELEIVLSTKQGDDLDFLSAVRSCVASTGNTYLFSLPADRFPIEASNVAAIQLESGDLACAYYVYETEAGIYHVAGPEEVGRDFIEFATNFSDIVAALRSVQLH